MLKKNQLALILLTLVMMLTIYFIKSPFEKDPNDNNNDTPTVGRLQELAALRVAVRDERALTVLALDAIIADNSKTITEKTAALNEKRYINNLTEKELLLELQIISKGFRDAFVHASDTGVEITVVAETHSVEKANEIIIMAMTSFNKEFESVVVQFQTVQEVIGGVS